MDTALVVFAAYSLGVIVIGWIAGRRPQKTGVDIHLGGREDSAITAALSAGASTESGFVLLGMVGAAYTLGLNAIWIVPAGIFGYALNWFLLGSRLRRKSEDLGAITVPEYLSKSLGGGVWGDVVKLLSSVAIVTLLISYTAAQFSASGKTMAAQFNLDYALSVFVGSGVVLLYSALGSYRAVTWTDVLQAIMMLFALVALPIVVIGAGGGLDAMWARLHAIDPKLTDPFGGASDSVGQITSVLSWLMLGLAYPGQPHALARLMAVKKTNSASNAGLIGILWFVAIYGGAVLLGLGARAFFSDVPGIQADPERTLPLLAAQMLPGVLAGITVAAIFAAIASTADSTLLSASTTIVRDLRAVFGFGPAKHELRWTQFLIFALGLVSIFFALQQTGLIFDLVLYAWSGLGASLGPVVIYCTIAKRPRGIAAAVGMAVGAASVLWLDPLTLDLLYAFIAGSVSIAIVHSAFPGMTGDNSSVASTRMQ